jgi:hypothetical protein
MLDILHTRRLDAEVTEKEGYAVYFLIPSHISRAIGSSEISASWGRHFSQYELQSDGAPKRVGNFVTGRPLLTLLFKLLNYSNVKQYFHLSFPLRFTDADYRLVAKLFAESKQLLEGELHLLQFVVILAPANDQHERDILHRVGAALEGEGIRVIDFSSLLDMTDRRYRLADQDPHNSALTNKLIAEGLIRELVLADP